MTSMLALRRTTDARSMPHYSPRQAPAPVAPCCPSASSARLGTRPPAGWPGRRWRWVERVRGSRRRGRAPWAGLGSRAAAWAARGAQHTHPCCRPRHPRAAAPVQATAAAGMAWCWRAATVPRSVLARPPGAASTGSRRRRQRCEPGPAPAPSPTVQKPSSSCWTRVQGFLIRLLTDQLSRLL